MSEVYGGTRMPQPGEYRRDIPWLWPVVRPANGYAHRLVIPEGESAWTLFITGPRGRHWGFWCPAGWKYWREYEADGGCGETDNRL